MCPTPIKPSAALPTSLADPVNPSGATPAKPTVSGLSSVDAMDRNASTVGAAKPVLAATTIPGIQESFPLADLSQLEAKGVQGQTLMLDAGSLRGLKLQVRRVKDEGKPGFEIVFRLTDSKIDALEERFEKSGAKSQQLTFRSTETDDDGICNYTAEKETIKHSVIHAPTDLEQNADEWALRVEGKKGGHIELATNEAAHALRGLVRVHLRGTDKQCTQQLDSLIKTLGLGFLFAPPTPKSKRVNMLMRVLFQHDHAKAIELSKGDLSKLKVSDLEKALETAGISKSRLDNMEYAEVFSGHFTVIDPMQSQEMAQAGARYLYSTLGNAEHVLSILQTGQKSSMQRYFEGAIINGMSTNSDFATGGAVGVFARVVTQDSIYENRAWTGRTFKLVQNYEQFARTDWYGWDSDKFGRRWDLNSDENFGPSLIAKIDNEGNYRATNEVVFTAGNDPKNIDRVVSTDITERQELIELLREHDYVPHNGMSLEKFVVYSPNFLLHGPSPYEFTNAKEFIKIAKDEAKSGNANKLKWYLLEGPDSSERSKLEGELLLSNEPKLSEIACFTVKRRGRFIQTGKSLHKTLSSLKKSRKKDARKTFQSLVKNSAPAFLRANDDFVLDMLTSNVKSVSSYRPYGIPRGEWSSIISEVVANQKSSKWSKTLELVMDERGLFLLQQKDKLFMQLLKESDVVGMSKSQRWETQQLNKLIKEKDITPQFLLYYAQKTLRGEGQELERRILEADRIHTHKLLDLMTEANEGFQQNPTALAATLSALPNDSELKQHILKTHAKTLLQMTSPEILDVIEDASASSSSTRPTFGLTVYQLQNLFSDFLETNKPLNVEFLRRVGEKCGSKISAQPETRIALASQPDLYDFSEPLNFAKNAIQDLKNRDKSYFQLTALISSQNVSEEAKEKVLFELLTSEAPNASPLNEELIKPDRDGRLPVSSDVIYGLLKKLHPKHPEGVKTLFESAGRMLLSGLTPTRIKELTPLIESESSLKSFNVSDRALVAIIRDHSKGQGAADRKVVNWLLENSVDRLLPERVLGYVELLTELGASREKVGKDVAWSVTLLQGLVARQKRNLLRATTNLSVDLFPETLWVLRNGKQTYDEAILEEVSKNINDWGWDKKLVAALIDRLPDLDDKWVEKWQKAVKIDG